jgi:hypothetical protein
VDATEEVARLGRLVNHGDSRKQQNARMMTLDTLVPSIGLFATRDIEVGEQILYDYGVRVPWIKQAQPGLFYAANLIISCKLNMLLLGRCQF